MSVGRSCKTTFFADKFKFPLIPDHLGVFLFLYLPGGKMLKISELVLDRTHGQTAQDGDFSRFGIRRLGSQALVGGTQTPTNALRGRCGMPSVALQFGLPWQTCLLTL